MDIVRVCQEELFSVYQESLNVVSSTPTMNRLDVTRSSLEHPDRDFPDYPESAVGIDVGEDLASSAVVPYPDLDSWPATNEESFLQKQASGNGNSEPPDLSYGSMNSLFQESSNGDEWWNDLDCNVTGVYPLAPRERHLLS